MLPTLYVLSLSLSVGTYTVTFAQAGDSINIKASLEPDKTGVAGLTIDLHYDPSKVTVYVPDEAT